ncbi:MAG: hypothetical protein JSU63_02730 [Phycisphaerales bacterium]|nr:MAG: hypothetical protein JSU63_02730 [Phycisphaerales bacterium]
MMGRPLHIPAARCSLKSRGVYRHARSRLTEHRTFAGVAIVAILTVLTACSREARHRALVFFYDGVPPLDAAVGEPVSDSPEGVLSPVPEETATRKEPAKELYSHPHYGQNLCGSCHDADGRLLKTVRQGLCQSCHFVKPEEKKKYVHGPVAVNGCLACHRYHTSRYPKILVTDAQTLCSHCHEEEQLTQDKHHATMDKERCIDCHDAHGGDDRFFLLPGVAERDFSRKAPIIERTQ